MILIATVGNFLDKPLMVVIVPVHAKTIYGSPTGLGLALGAFGAGALTALAQAGIPIGSVLAGVVVQQAGLVPTILGMGALYLLVPLGMFFNRSLHRMDAAGPR